MYVNFQNSRPSENLIVSNESHKTSFWKGLKILNYKLEIPRELSNIFEQLIFCIIIINVYNHIINPNASFRSEKNNE